MANWTVSTYYKKSIEEHEHFVKDGQKLVYQTGWRGGSYTVTTSDDNPPEFEFVEVPGGDGRRDSIDMYNCCENNIEEVELIETYDGWWAEIEWPDDMDEEEQQRLQELIDEEGVYSLEDQEDWMHDETEMYIWGPIQIEGENGFIKIIIADENGKVVDFKED
jgi:hypothetical protein